jgi:hypothetical protein
MVPDGARWLQMAPDDSHSYRWHQMAPDGSSWLKVVPDDSSSFKVASDGSRWLQMIPFGSRSISLLLLDQCMHNLGNMHFDIALYRVRGSIMFIKFHFGKQAW